MKSSLPSVLITGASTGIGATYAQRFAARGHSLVLVARNQARLESLAATLRSDHGVHVEVLAADLTDRSQLGQVERRLREDGDIGMLVNNAGAASAAGFAAPDIEGDDQLVRLNVVAVTRLTEAVLPRFLKAAQGAIINVASVLGVAPEVMPGVYSATKAYVLTFSQALHHELGEKGVYVQAVLPSATRTEIWGRSGLDIEQIPGLMDVGDMVDAALVGFDRRELVTLPSLPDARQWESFEAARRAMIPNFRNAAPAARYLTKPLGAAAARA